jgi:hypothetical protein
VAPDADLTVAQKQSLTQIYETFRRENARGAAEAVGQSSVAEAVGASGTESVTPSTSDHVDKET